MKEIILNKREQLGILPNGGVLDAQKKHAIDGSNYNQILGFIVSPQRGTAKGQYHLTNRMRKVPELKALLGQIIHPKEQKGGGGLKGFFFRPKLWK